MPQLQSNGRRKRYAYIKSSVHVFKEIIKLNGVEFRGNKLIVEEEKTLPTTIYSNNAFIKSSNFLEPLPNIPPPKPANPTRSNADQPLMQNVKNSHPDAIMPNKKDIAWFADNKIKRGKVHLKSLRVC